MKHILEIGDIILVSNNKKKGLRGFLAKAIKFFTKSQWTHTAVSIGNIVGSPCILEADTQVIINPATLTFDDPNYVVAVYRNKLLTKKENIEIVNELFHELNGNTYGYLQLLYFIRRWFWEKKTVQFLFGWIPKLLGKPADIRQWNNWFVGGTICSELIWWVFEKQSKKINDEILRWKMQEWITAWNSNNFDPKDAHLTLAKFPEIYELIYWK